MLVGEWPIQANSRAALESSRVYAQLSASIDVRVGDLDDSVRDVRDALPGEAGREYERAVASLTGGRRGGRGVLTVAGEFSLEISIGQRINAQVVFKAKVSMSMELAFCLAALALVFALAPFTGGASAGQAALIRARSRVRLLLIMHFLSRHSRVVPALDEAVQEGLTEFLTQLVMMSSAPKELRQKRLDWRDIARSSTAGLFAGLFSDLTRKLLDP
ncbi:hypothetical protein ACIP10_36615, partial [Streptomyces galbus]|uniref:WXG100-like domain-containing protein n=1 Tax=Streptomyces galbus TaxID=33898 RepID=UPI00381F0278